MRKENSKNERQYDCPTYGVVLRAQEGDGAALMAIVRYFDPFLRLSSIHEIDGKRRFDADLYERLKAKVLWAAFKFKFDPSTVTPLEMTNADGDYSAALSERASELAALMV